MKKIEVPGEKELNAFAHAEGWMSETGFSGFKSGFETGIAYANEQLEAEAARQDEPWQPLFGMKCAFWNTGEAYTRTDLWVGHNRDLWGIMKHVGHHLTHGSYCAALESLDEIGREPSYFIKRGRCTV